MSFHVSNEGRRVAHDWEGYMSLQGIKSITLALLLVLFAQIPALCQKQQTVSVQGKAYAAHFGALLSGIELKLLRDGRAIKSTKTDKEGNYLLNDILAGNYSILIEELGFVTKRLNIELAEGEQKILDIEVEAGHLETIRHHKNSILPEQ